MPTNSRYVSPITAPPFFPDRPWRVITPVLALAARLPTGCAPRSPRRGAGPSPALGAQVGEALSARRPKSTPRLSMGGRRRHRVHRVSRCTLLFTTVRGGTFSGRPTGFLRSPRHELDRKVQGGGWVQLIKLQALALGLALTLALIKWDRLHLGGGACPAPLR